MGSSPGSATAGGGTVRRVLGVDPGTVCTGWGLVETAGQRLSYVASGIVRPRGARPDRLGAICQVLIEVCERFLPDAVVIEQTFVGENIQSAFRLGEARGAVMVAAAQSRRQVTEYSPAEIKVAVTGSGRATKIQMQAMVSRLLSLSAALAPDEADALGAAICHLHRSRYAAEITEAVGRAQATRRRSWRSLRVP